MSINNLNINSFMINININDINYIILLIYKLIAIHIQYSGNYMKKINYFIVGKTY